MRKNYSVIIERISTGEVPEDAYFEDCGNVDGEYVSKVVVDGKEYVSKISRDIILYALDGCEARYKNDIDFFAKYDLNVRVI